MVAVAVVVKIVAMVVKVVVGGGGGWVESDGDSVALPLLPLHFSSNRQQKRYRKRGQPSSSREKIAKATAWMQMDVKKFTCISVDAALVVGNIHSQLPASQPSRLNIPKHS
jgi:hypothetical protein